MIKNAIRTRKKHNFAKDVAGSGAHMVLSAGNKEQNLKLRQCSDVESV